MKSILINTVLLALLGGGTTVFGQDDEVRQATGLPTLIGENNQRGSKMNVSGRITLAGAETLQRKPVINVLAQMQGSTADRSIANDQGFFLLKNISRVDVTLVVEVDGIEVIRQPLPASSIGNPRYDFTVQWPPAAADAKPGVIRADQMYQRTAAAEALLSKAIAAGKANDSAKAVTLLNELLSGDAKDYVAWTELGTIYFRQNQLDNAEGAYFKAIELKRDYFGALLNLGKLYLGAKRFDEATLVLSNAVAAIPSSPDARHYLGESLLGSKKNSQAVVQLNEAIKLAPAEKAELHLRLAALYDAAKMKDKAAHEYKTFLQKKPDYPDRAKLEKYITDNPPKP
jgi:Flp pilus assembly protein TadD